MPYALECGVEIIGIGFKHELAYKFNVMFVCFYNFSMTLVSGPLD